MALSVNKRLFVAWLVLVGDHVDLPLDRPRPRTPTACWSASTVVTVAAIGLALVKVRIIMRRVHGRPTRAAAAAPPHRSLVVVMAVALLGTYLVGRALA